MPNKRVCSAGQVDAPAGTFNGASAAPAPAHAEASATSSLGQLQDPALWQLPAFSQAAAYYALGYGNKPAGMALAMTGSGSMAGFGFQGLLPLSAGAPALPGALSLPQPQLDLPRSASASHLLRGTGLRSALSQGAASRSAAGASDGAPGAQPGGLEAADAWRAAPGHSGLGLTGPGAYVGGMGARASSASNLPALRAARQVAWMPGASARLPAGAAAAQHRGSAPSCLSLCHAHACLTGCGVAANTGAAASLLRSHLHCAAPVPRASAWQRPGTGMAGVRRGGRKQLKSVRWGSKHVADEPCTRAGGETAAAMVRSASVSAMAPPRAQVPPTPAFSGQPAEPQPSAGKPAPYEGAPSGAHASRSGRTGLQVQQHLQK